jgi:Transposase
MKKISTAAVKQNRNFPEQKLTIGFDLGDRSSWYCVLDEQGEVMLEQKLSTTPKAMKEVFGAMPRCRIALETGMHSPWVSRLLSELGHEVIVAHARNVRLIGESRKKDDRMDARTLARLARIDPQLLSPVKHRSAKAQADLTVIRARAGLVRARTALVNTARGLAKSYGERLRGCNVRNMNPEKAEGLSPELQSALEPLLAGTGELPADRAAEAGERRGHADRADLPADAGGSTPFPQESGRGLLSGIAAGTAQLGTERTADAHQQGRRSVSAHAAGAGSAPHPRSVWCRQRPAALGTETRRTWRQEWKETRGDRDGTKAGRLAASTVGKWRGVRTAVQQQPASDAGSRIKSKSSAKGKAKAQSRVSVTALIAWPTPS